MIHAPLDLILKRRADIQGVIADLTSRIDALRQELDELDVAERVLTRLGGAEQGAVTGASATAFLGPAAERLLDEAPVVSKPPGIPTMPEMILEALASVLNGLEPRDIMAYIAGKYWPEVRSELVGPIAWRMWKRGDLVKDGPRYKLPQKNEPTDTLSQDASAGSFRRRI